MSVPEVVLSVAVLGIGTVAGWAAWRLAMQRRSQGAKGSAEAAPLGRTLVGRYRLVRELGRGAMGTVYLGEDLQGGTPVAIKVIALPARPAGDDESADTRARFFGEARAARRLRHPDIVTVFDAGEDAGLAFIAMELLQGRDLSAHTHAGALLPLGTVLGTVARVALALDHAHRLGVVHRDVKPGNVMLDRASGAVKVTDFGIASVGDVERTRTGVLLGTPYYMSPEQMAGGRVDGRSDLYSLGVVLYELLTGALPYRDGTPAELLRQIAEAPAPDVRERRPDLPEALADILALALQKRAGLRYADGAAFAADLRELSRRIAADGNNGAA